MPQAAIAPGWTGVEAISCAWCGTGLDGGASRLPGRAICSSCGCGTTDPVPDAASLNAAYATYRPSDSRFALGFDSLLRRSRATLASHIDRTAPSGPVLDVGAGDGNLVDALRDRGRSATGLEREPVRPDLTDLPITEVEGEFTAIVFWHSLEHLGNPAESVRAAARLSVPGGLLVIAVPDISGLQARTFKDNWLHLDLPRHLVHLRSDSLLQGLRDSGFEITAVSRTRAGQNLIGWLDGLVRSLPGRLNLYQALRRREARQVPMNRADCVLSIAAGVILAPVALACTAFELATGRSGTVYVEARLA